MRQHAILKELREHRVKLFHRKSAAVLSTLFLLPFTAQALENPTIASTSLCGDSYLLALAPEHISALSWQSRSPLSRAEAAHQKLPQIWDDPEILITAKADIILFGSGEGEIGENLEAKTVTLRWGEDFGTIQENATAITQALNIQSDMLDNLKHRMERLKQRRDRAAKPKVLYLSRSGGSAGAGTFVDAAITAAGGVNIVQETGWFTPDPERLIAYEPDLIITSYFKNGYESVQATTLRNKVVQRFIAKHPTIDINGSLWPCAGPGLIDAAEHIAGAIDRLP